MWKCWQFGSGRRVSARPRRIRPCLEALEDRLCPSTLTVTTLADPSSPMAGDGSLRGELLQNVKDGGGDTIVFAAGLNGTIFLNSGNGPLSNGGKSVSIANPNGDTITISGQDAVEDLDLTGGTGVNVSISGQSASGAGSLTFTSGKVSTTSTVAKGGGIVNSASTVLSNVAVTGSTATASSSNALGGWDLQPGCADAERRQRDRQHRERLRGLHRRGGRHLQQGHAGGRRRPDRRQHRGWWFRR